MKLFLITLLFSFSALAASSSLPIRVKLLRVSQAVIDNHMVTVESGKLTDYHHTIIVNYE